MDYIEFDYKNKIKYWKIWYLDSKLHFNFQTAQEWDETSDKKKNLHTTVKNIDDTIRLCYY